jgi:hypothetical protein
LVPPTEYVVQVDGEARRGRFTAIVLPQARREVLVAFTVLAAGLLAGLPDSPTQREIQDFIDGFVELFRSSPDLDLNTTKGLWGELWLIFISNNPHNYQLARDSGSRVRFDFAFADLNLEVKTHEGQRPVHHFSHSQLTAESEKTIVVSLLIREDAAGHSIAEMMDRIAAVVSVESRSLLMRKVFAILGTSFDSASELRYSTDDLGGVRGVYASHLPSVVVPEGAMIDQITYRVDISEPLEKFGMSLEALLMRVAVSN